MYIWRLLKAYVREFEIANHCQFDNGAWQRIKKLEADIQSYVSEGEDETRQLYTGDIAVLRDLLKCAVAGRVIITSDGKWQAQVTDGALVIEQREHEDGSHPPRGEQSGG